MAVKKKQSTFDQQVESPKTPVKISFYKHSVFLPSILAAALVITLSVGVYYYIQYQNAKNVLGSSSKAANDAAELVKKVGKLIELPSGENPTIATVSDIKKLKGQAFFAHAKNGDKVLIYQKSKKAILYNPATNKIVEVQVINISSAEQNTASPSASVTQPVKVGLLNGTKIVGLANATEKNLTAVLKNITVVSKGNAKTDATSTLVVDLSADKAGLSGKNSVVATQIANTLKGQVGKLPEGEVKPTNADILVILGKQN